MNRDEFFATVDTLDDEALRKVLWDLYWRGTAKMRERIAAHIAPDRHRHGPADGDVTIDAMAVLTEVHEFVSLARSGAYLAGNRRVSPKERTRWRFTFKRLAADVQAALETDDIDPAATAAELLIDLACDTKEYDRFRSDDPMQAAGFVVSDAVALLWRRLLGHHGLVGFADLSAPQLIRWEAEHGWTRYGSGSVADQETRLATVLTELLPAQDAWLSFAPRYLDALDAAVDELEVTARRAWRDPALVRAQRTRALCTWHLTLLDRLVHTEGEQLLDRLVDHPALEGPSLTYLRAQLAHRRDDLARARELVHDALEAQPGHRDFHDLAERVGAPLPPRAREIANKSH